MFLLISLFLFSVCFAYLHNDRIWKSKHDYLFCRRQKEQLKKIAVFPIQWKELVEK